MSTARANYVVVGDNPLAFRLAKTLSTRFSGTVTVIVPDAGSRYALEMAGLTDVRLVEAERVDETALRTAHADTAAAAALVDQDDGGNVALALLLREVWPTLRVVVRIFDESLGRHLEGEHCTALSSSAFAAPEIVAAALRRQVALPGKPPLVASSLTTDVDSRRPGSRTSLADQVLFATDGDARVVALPTERELDELEAAVVIVDADPGEVLSELDDDLEPDDDEVDPHRRWRFGEYLRTLAVTSWRNLLVAAGVLLVVVLVGAAVIKIATGSSWAGALYEAVLPSLAGSDPDHEAHPVVKATQVVLTIVSVAVIPWVTGVVVDGVVRTQRLLDEGSPLRAMAGHVVVVGMGDLGTRVMRSLKRRGVRVIAVDVDESARGIAVARARDVPVVIGDARRATTLRNAYVGSAQAIVVVTSGGATTIGVGFAARSIPRQQGAPESLRTVLRVYDKDLSRRIRAEIPDSVGLSSSFLAAPWFAAAMIGQEVKAIIPFRDRVLVLAEVLVEEGSVLARHDSSSSTVTFDDAQNGQLTNVPQEPPVRSRMHQIHSVEQVSGGGDRTFRPTATRGLNPGDRVYAFVTTAGLVRLREMASAPHRSGGGG